MIFLPYYNLKNIIKIFLNLEKSLYNECACFICVQAYRLGKAPPPVIHINKNSLISEGVYHQSHFLGVRCGLSEHSYILHSKITVPIIDKY